MLPVKIVFDFLSKLLSFTFLNLKMLWTIEKYKINIYIVQYILHNCIFLTLKKILLSIGIIIPFWWKLVKISEYLCHYIYVEHCTHKFSFSTFFINCKKTPHKLTSTSALILSVSCLRSASIEVWFINLPVNSLKLLQTMDITCMDPVMICIQRYDNCRKCIYYSSIYELNWKVCLDFLVYLSSSLTVSIKERSCIVAAVFPVSYL